MKCVLYTEIKSAAGMVHVYQSKLIANHASWTTLLQCAQFCMAEAWICSMDVLNTF